MICTKLHTYINFISLQVSIIPRSQELPKKEQETRKINNNKQENKTIKEIKQNEKKTNIKE